MDDTILNAISRTASHYAVAKRITELSEQFAPLGNKAGRAAVGLDLDKTIIYTNSSIELPDTARETLRLVEFYKGKPLSFMTEATYAMLAVMAEEAHVLPVTARRQDQMDRIMFPWGVPQDYVCLSGAIVSVGGEIDQDWSKHVREEVDSSSIPLDDVKKIIDPYEGEDWVIARNDFGKMFEVVTLDLPRTPQAFLDEVEEKVKGTGFFSSVQGRKLYLTPDRLSKGEAFLHLTDRLGVEGNTYGAGDSLMDVALLEKVDFAFHPLHGEMTESDAAPEHSIQSIERGILGGEEIIARIFASVIG